MKVILCYRFLNCFKVSDLIRTLIEDPLILVHYFKYATTLERDKGDMSCVWRIRPVVAIQDRVVPQNNSLPFTSSSFFFGRTLSSQSKFKAAYVLGQLQNIAASDALSRVLKDVNEHPMVRHAAAEALGSIAVRGGNFNALTNEWVNLGYVLSLMDQLGLRRFLHKEDILGLYRLATSNVE
ncbi:deoxyhypusine hydroxylase-B [Tanacetum coccineum]